MMNDQKSCVVIGNFDGIHLGHDKLIKDMLSISKKNSLKPVILTFKFSDDSLKKNAQRMKYITSFNKKMELLRKRYRCRVEAIDLDSEICKMSPTEFVKNILSKKLNAANIVVGFDFRFGYKASGSVRELYDFEDIYGYKLYVMNAVKYHGVKISSSLIREAIKNGEIKTVNKLLVGNYTIYNNRISKLTAGKYLLQKDVEILYPKDGKYNVSVCGLAVEIRIETVENDTYIYTNNEELGCDLVFIEY